MGEWHTLTCHHEPPCPSDRWGAEGSCSAIRYLRCLRSPPPMAPRLARILLWPFSESPWKASPHVSPCPLLATPAVLCWGHTLHPVRWTGNPWRARGGGSHASKVGQRSPQNSAAHKTAAVAPKRKVTGIPFLSSCLASSQKSHRVVKTEALGLSQSLGPLRHPSCKPLDFGQVTYPLAGRAGVSTGL
jgi:hypothetical protein